MKNSLSHWKKIHMIGIKGAGMTALAELLSQQSVHITGSDTSEVFFTDRILKKRGIVVSESFDAKNIPAKIDAVIYSTAYSKEKNSELAEAYTRNIPVLSYPEALGMLTREKMTLAVCGTHGKTTTSALLADTLKSTGLDPSAIVGSRIMTWEGNALSGQGNFLVLEADEYQNKLMEYSPFAVILTSVDFDHPDFFINREQYEQVFRDFVKRIPHHGVLIYCNDQASVANIARDAVCQKFSYGLLPGADFHISQYEPVKMGFSVDADAPRQSFEVTHNEVSLGIFQLKLSGVHNAMNAVAVLALCTFLKQDIAKVKKAFEKFRGTERRFEYVGERYGAFVYDDYAHHPEEIKATLLAFREIYPERKLRVVFHPHTFTRTKALLTEFAQSFDTADEVYILDIYGSAREVQGGVSSEELVTLINRFVPGKARYEASEGDLTTFFTETMGRQDVIITLGAGDVWKIAHALVKKNEK